MLRKFFFALHEFLYGPAPSKREPLPSSRFNAETATLEDVETIGSCDPRLVTIAVQNHSGHVASFAVNHISIEKKRGAIVSIALCTSAEREARFAAINRLHDDENVPAAANEPLFVKIACDDPDRYVAVYASHLVRSAPGIEHLLASKHKEVRLIAARARPEYKERTDALKSLDGDARLRAALTFSPDDRDLPN